MRKFIHQIGGEITDGRQGEYWLRWEPELAPPIEEGNVGGSDVHRRRARESVSIAVQLAGQQPLSPAQYLSRTITDRLLGDFLVSNRTALLLVGEAGVGKTATLIQWAMRLEARGHLVFDL